MRTIIWRGRTFMKQSIHHWYISVLAICTFWVVDAAEKKEEPSQPIAATEEVLRFSELVDQYDAFLLDAYGVFWESNEMGMFPGAAEAMKDLVTKGKIVGVLSNSTQLAEKEKDKLAKRGIVEGTHYHFFLTSGQVTRDLLDARKLPFKTPRQTYWMFSPPHPRFPTQLSLFEGTRFRQVDRIEDADFIYVTIPHIDGVDQVDLEAFRGAVEEISNRKIPVLCANPDLWGCEGSQLFVRQGGIAKLLESYGFNVYFIGKPEPIVYEEALQRFAAGIKPERVLMVGDTPETDIRGAHRLGLSTALVTQTGVTGERLKGGSFALQQLPATDKPDCFVDRFAIR